MADKDVSPEERLFKVIQEAKKSPADGAGSTKKKLKIDLRGIKQFFVNLRPKLGPKERLLQAQPAQVSLPITFKEISPETIHTINKALAAIIAVLTILVLYSAIKNRPNIAKFTDAISKIQFPALKKKAIESFQPVAFYLEAIKKRDIFKPAPQTEKEIAATPRARETQARLQELVKDLKLVGISWGDSPKAMIRSEKEKNTYFLRQGQAIGTTGIEVKTILKDKVILSYQGVEMELL